MGIRIDFDLSTILISAIIWIGIVVFLRRRRNKSIVYLLFFTIFFVYIIATLQYTQFPIYLTESMRAYGQNVWITMNVVPLIGLEYRDVTTSLLNILLTVPFGFGLPFITSMRFRSIVIVAILFSVTLETLQILSALVAGHTFRVIDINDVIFNTLGVVIGYALFVGFIRVVRLALDKWHIEQNVILRHIYERPQISRGHVDTSSHKKSR